MAGSGDEYYDSGMFFQNLINANEKCEQLGSGLWGAWPVLRSLS